ncbi:MAG TPA: NAD(P)-dependent oxidoreductase [Candidatus Binatia bacterium]
MALSPVMVVGGAGFLGAHVCRVLAGENRDVICFDLQPPELPLLQPVKGRGTVRFTQGNILNPDALARSVKDSKVAGIVHTVAAGNEAAARQAPYPAITLNVQGTLNVLEAVRTGDVSRFVYISTAGVYGKRKDETPVGENEPITWRGTIYHPSHYMGEILVEMYREVYGINSVILRPLSIYGPALTTDREQHLRKKSLFLGSWIEKAIRGETVAITAADTVTDLTYIRDIAGAVSLAYPRQNQKQVVYNVSSGTLVTYRDIALAIKECVPGATFEFSPGIQDNPLRPNRGPLDISRARNDLGYTPQYDLKQGMREFVEWSRGG